VEGGEVESSKMNLYSRGEEDGVVCGFLDIMVHIGSLIVIFFFYIQFLCARPQKLAMVLVKPFFFVLFCFVLFCFVLFCLYLPSQVCTRSIYVRFFVSFVHGLFFFKKKFKTPPDYFSWCVGGFFFFPLQSISKGVDRRWEGGTVIVLYGENPERRKNTDRDLQYICIPLCMEGSLKGKKISIVTYNEEGTYFPK
jgi:hypothetical protein